MSISASPAKGSSEDRSGGSDGLGVSQRPAESVQSGEPTMSVLEARSVAKAFGTGEARVEAVGGWI